MKEYFWPSVAGITIFAAIFFVADGLIGRAKVLVLSAAGSAVAALAASRLSKRNERDTHRESATVDSGPVPQPQAGSRPSNLLTDVAKICRLLKKASERGVAFLVYEKWPADRSVLAHSGTGCKEIVNRPGGRLSKSYEFYIELGLQMALDPTVWRRFSAALSGFAGNQSSARALILVRDLPCEGSEEVSASDQWQKVVSVATAAIGGRIPVYVIYRGLENDSDIGSLFAKYAGFVRPNDALGVTLPVPLNVSEANWTAYQAGRIDTGTNSLFTRLAERLPVQLGVPDQTDNRRAAFRFPRFFRWFPKSLGTDLVEQTGADPDAAFLRGFYFTGMGVRPVIESPLAEIPSKSESDAHALLKGLRASLRLKRAALRPARLSYPEARRLEPEAPRFLEGVFNVVVDDLRRWSGAPARWMRVAFFAGLGLATVIGVLFIPWYKNHRLLNDAQAVSVRTSTSTDVSDSQRVAGLMVLEKARMLVERLRDHETNGRPFWFGFGFYQGRNIVGDVQQAYLSHVRSELVSPTREAMRGFLQALPGSRSSLPEDTQPSFKNTYDTLKAYLMITYRPDKVDSEFLTEALTNWWMKTRKFDRKDVRDLAAKQFAAFSTDLIENSPGRITPGLEVDRGRKYLQAFGATEGVYERITDDASKKVPEIDFAALYSQSAQVIVKTPRVPGAFTKVGFSLVSKQLAQISQAFKVEQWVVELPSIDTVQVTTDLRERYEKEFIADWTTFLKQTDIVVCRARLQDTAKQLRLLSGADGQSALMQLFGVVAQNTDVPFASPMFVPVQHIVSPDPAATQSIADLKKALFELSDALASAPENDVRSSVGGQIRSANSAVYNVKQLVVGVGSQTSGEAGEQENVVRKEVIRLLDRPVSEAEACIPGLQFGGCQKLMAAVAGYPFGRRGEATVTDVDTSIASLNQFYRDRLSDVITHSDSGYAPNSASGKQVNGDFVRLLNWSERVKKAISGSNDVLIRASATPGIKSIKLKVDGQEQELVLGRDEFQRFTWKQSAAGAEMSVALDGGVSVPGPPAPGPWGILRLFDQMHLVRRSDSEVSFDWEIREKETNRPLLNASGKPLTISFTVKGAILPLLDPASRAFAGCPSKIAE
ncbi:MAG: hypothetical protein JO097_08850 [Acidobacteriaceae bacterium]|nr:hypothetical protein [Acidobacteriaceae bacterium]MBV9296418.1 hypothetical protein [Acidobacteriaceae bacterium]MBV9764370.1 hypothetical protein [Acidobacteriaceae bacterium]